jgi:hypothetical protein
MAGWYSSRARALDAYSTVVEVDGEPLTSVAQLRRLLVARPLGTTIRYGLWQRTFKREVEIPTRSFTGGGPAGTGRAGASRTDAGRESPAWR